ncbi:hypothetical protein FOC4_g10009415 [Fusarium odoratissimum]|uniref:Uncharacterized protein n=1 Tax=Fusarium oxysporum f. sp. cubense (strain race 4) TaxID=2502994 RepID=N1S8F6_FUSC4|nr:hypothetical protein FOC4_g10009415 [Fusarium odoratissimum]
MSDVSSSFVGLMYEANKRGNLSQIQLLIQDYRDGPNVRTASGAQSNSSSVERSLTSLSRWTS